jgi:O-methyltransferase domain
MYALLDYPFIRFREGDTMDSQIDHGAAPPPPALVMQQLVQGVISTQLIGIAVKLQIADHLSEGARTSDHLAQILGLNAQALHRAMRALVSFGVFAETADGLFALTPMGELLKSDAGGSVRNLAVAGYEVMLRTAASFHHTIQTGEPAFEHAFGRPFFDYLMAEPAIGALFAQSMTALSHAAAAGLAAISDFSKARRIVDVGGGRGHFLATILKANPGLDGVVLDLPHVVPAAESYLEDEGVRARCQVVAGDFFEAVPSGGDVYLLSWILHDWDDERCVRILTACRKAMTYGARLIIVETILPDRVEQNPFAIMSDLNMLMLVRGRERTLSEYVALLSRCGFKLERDILIPLSFGTGMRSVLEAVPVTLTA